ncbi:MAG: hypothetical protein WBG71_15400 [Leeuwenhoekiella sp.]
MIPYLEYYKSIEQDLTDCTRYVEFDSRNFDTYSIEFARIIMASSSEIDMVFKLICKSIDPDSNPQNILQYYPILTSKYPRFTTIEMEVPKFNISFKPWENWNQDNSPVWWRGYNKIKHERDLNFEKASLINTLNSVGALLSLLLYYGVEKIGNYREFQVDAFNAPIFITSKEMEDGIQGASISKTYDLPDFE